MLTLIQYEMKKTAFMKILCFSATSPATAFRPTEAPRPLCSLAVQRIIMWWPVLVQAY